MKITLDQILEQWQEWLTECDLDDLAEETGRIFGGECEFIFNPEDELDAEQEFEFIPNENYQGAFDKKKGRKNG